MSKIKIWLKLKKLSATKMLFTIVDAFVLSMKEIISFTLGITIFVLLISCFIGFGLVSENTRKQNTKNQYNSKIETTNDKDEKQSATKGYYNRGSYYY